MTGLERSLLQFGQAFSKILEGFKAIDVGNITASVQALAYHEQIDVLQRVIYNDPDFSQALRDNQFLYGTNVGSFLATPVQLTLSNQCSLPTPNAQTINFSNNSSADLADPLQRMEFVNRAANEFNVLLQNPADRAKIEEAISQIAENGGAN
jgi:hypothetical protein